MKKTSAPRFFGFVLILLIVASFLLQAPTFPVGAFSQNRTFSGTLRLATEPVTRTDPAFISNDSEIAVANAVYDYLVDIDADNRIQPRLATDWTISEDGLTYVFHLAEGVRFHDGTPFTAEDVVWTFNRLRDPQVGSGAANLLQNIEGIEATDELEVTFRLKEVDPFFLFDLSDNRALVIKRDTTDPKDFNGTGPFRVINYNPEDRIVMAANPDYFIEGQPRLEKLEIIFFPDDAARLDALRSGQVDLVWRLPSALFLILEGEPGLETHLVPTNAFVVIRLRTDQAPGNDPRVIQAFKLTIDREELFDNVLLGLGALGNDSPIGPLYKDYHVPATFVRDVEKARQLLRDAGYPDGLEIQLSTPDTIGLPDVAVLVKEHLADIGVRVNVVVRPQSIYYGSDEWLDANFGITSWGSRPVPQFYVDVMLVCDAIWNEARLCDDEFDRLARITGTTLDETQRKQAYADMQRILKERGPLIVPYFFSQNAAIRKGFEGFRLKAFVGRTDFRAVRLKSP